MDLIEIQSIAKIKAYNPIFREFPTLALGIEKKSHVVGLRCSTCKIQNFKNPIKEHKKS